MCDTAAEWLPHIDVHVFVFQKFSLINNKLLIYVLPGILVLQSRTKQQPRRIHVIKVILEKNLGIERPENHKGCFSKVLEKLVCPR